LFALELARQLEEAGEKLDFLLLLDPTLPDDTREPTGERRATAPAVSGDAASTGWIQRNRAGLRGLSFAQKLTYFRARFGVLTHLARKYSERLKLRLGRIYNALGRDIPFPLRERVATHYYRSIREAYRPAPLRSRVVVYLLNRHAAERRAVLERLFPAGLDVRLLETTRHLEVMEEPFLSQWMAELKRHLTANPEVVSVAPPAAENERIDSHATTPEAFEADPEQQFRVAHNAEGQFSVWPVDSDLPPGWTALEFSGDRDSCLAHIDRTWSDPRPVSLR
jgi:MbtH protein